MNARKILVADEDNDTRVILRTVLERNAWAIVEAPTTEEAIAAAQDDRFDLIILNYPMSDVSGHTLVELLRASDTTRDTPILNLTSRVVPQFLKEAADQGVTYSLPKPMDVERVVAVVHELTRGSELLSR